MDVFIALISPAKNLTHLKIKKSSLTAAAFETLMQFVAKQGIIFLDLSDTSIPEIYMSQMERIEFPNTMLQYVNLSENVSLKCAQILINKSPNLQVLLPNRESEKSGQLVASKKESLDSFRNIISLPPPEDLQISDKMEPFVFRPMDTNSSPSLSSSSTAITSSSSSLSSSSSTAITSSSSSLSSSSSTAISSSSSSSSATMSSLSSSTFLTASATQPSSQNCSYDIVSLLLRQSLDPIAAERRQAQNEVEPQRHSDSTATGRKQTKTKDRQTRDEDTGTSLKRQRQEAAPNMN